MLSLALLATLSVAIAAVAASALVAVLFLWRRERNAARRLLESQVYLERLFLESPFPMWVADRDGTLLLMSHAAERLFGVSEPASVVGRYNLFRDNVLRDMGLLPEVRRAMQGETVTVEGEYDPGKVEGFHVPSRSLHVRTTFAPILDARGEVRNLLVMHEDMTETSRAGEDVREANRQLQALLQSSRLVVSTLELQTLLERTARIVQDLLPSESVGGIFLYEPETDSMVLGAPVGFEPPEAGLPRLQRGEGLAGRVFAHVQTIHHTDPGDVRDDIDSLPEANRAALLRVSRGRMPASSVAVPVMAGGKLIGALVAFGLHPHQPIPPETVALLASIADHAAVAIENARLYEALQVQARELDALNRRLRHAVEELKTLDEMKTNLLSNVSHELRTPLIAILGYTDLMLQGRLGPVTDTQRERLQIAMRNAQRLSRLIEDLLTFSRSEMGKIELEVVAFDLREVLRESVEMIRPKAEARGIGIEMNFPAEGLVIRGDRVKIGQVFSNLLSNAEKFNRDGGSITVEAKTPVKGAIRVNVHDTGIGIPREEQERIFDRFYQVDSGVARRYGGTGIGLSLARSIVALHGGQIKVRSEPDRGATFTVSLPVYDETRDSGRFSLPRSAPGEGQSS